MDQRDLKKDLNKLFGSMDYIADNYLSRRKAPSKETAVFYSIYQQLGLLWEFFGRQCKHWDGYRKKQGKLFCKICGKAKGTKKRYYRSPEKQLRTLRGKIKLMTDVRVARGRSS